MLPILMIVAGIAAAVFGLIAAHRFKKPFDAAAALLFVVGIACALAGALLTVLPNFFKE